MTPEVRGVKKEKTVEDVARSISSFYTLSGLVSVNRENAARISAARRTAFTGYTAELRGQEEVKGRVGQLLTAIDLAQAAVLAYQSPGAYVRGVYEPHLHVTGSGSRLLTDVLLSRLSTRGEGALATTMSPGSFTTPQAEAENMRQQMGLEEGAEITQARAIAHVLSGQLRVLPTGHEDLIE